MSVGTVGTSRNATNFGKKKQVLPLVLMQMLEVEELVILVESILLSMLNQLETRLEQRAVRNLFEQLMD